MFQCFDLKSRLTSSASPYLHIQTAKLKSVSRDVPSDHAATFFKKQP